MNHTYRILPNITAIPIELPQAIFCGDRGQFSQFKTLFYRMKIGPFMAEIRPSLYYF